jgi:osmotically-inducible protein OsmY
MPSDAPADEPDQYVLEHLRDALAHDPRTNELDVDVCIVGDKVFLTGHAATDEHRDAITDVARQAMPGRQIVNEMSAGAFEEGAGREQLQ